MNIIKTTLASYTGSATINLTGSTLTFSMSIGEEDAPEIVANLSEIISKYSQDHGIIAVGQKDGNLLVAETTAISVGYRGSPFIGEYNTARRDSALAVYRSLGTTGYPAIFILTPYRGCSLEECTLYFFESADFEVTVNGQPLAGEEIERLADYLATWLPISFAGPTTVSAGGQVELTLACPDHVEVYLESTAGILNRSRAKNGDIVRLDLDDLPASTVARIKAGYKFWPGKIDYSITVQ